MVSCFPECRIEQIDAATQFVLLACDGIWDVKTSQQAIDFMSQKLYKGTFSTSRSVQEMEAAMVLLLDDCCARDIAASQGLGCDNMTAIIVEINQNK